MKVENTSPKFNNIKINNPHTVFKGTRATHSQSFGAGSIGSGVVSLMDMIDRGGFVAAFLVQDFLGMNIPRTATGLYRNREVTNQYNYQEAAEVAIREFVSGPTMLSVPMIMLWAIKRMFGKANDIPVNVLRVMGDNFAEYAQKRNPAELADIKVIKEQFYDEMFTNILKNTYKSDVTDETITKQAKLFTKDLLEYEQLKKDKKTMKFFDKVAGKKVDGTAESVLSRIVQRFSDINKSNTTNISANFMEARLSYGDKTVGKSIDKIVVDMKNYIEDISSSVAKRVKKGGFKDGELKQFLNNFTDFRSGSRVITNISMILGTIAFCSFIPKLYQLSANNPGLKGIETDEQPSKTNATKKESQKSKQVAFSGPIDGLGRLASKKGFLSKFFNEFEFDHYNLSFSGVLAACGFGVLLPRLYHAREENEYKEVLFRDTTTIGTIACAAKILQQIFAKVCTDWTGFALKIKPNMEGKSKLGQALTYLRPVKGHSVLTSDQLYTKYTNIEKYNGGMAGFARFIDEQDGNIAKAFNVDKEAKNLLVELYQKSVKNASVPFEKAKNSDIIEALDDVIKNNKANDLLEKVYAIFRDEKNPFLQKAKVLNSSFNFGVLFVVAPVLLGFVIPRMNEILTKRRQLSKQDAQKNMSIDADKMPQTQKSKEVAKTEMKTASSPSIQSNSKAFSAFREIIEVN